MQKRSCCVCGYWCQLRIEEGSESSSATECLLLAPHIFRFDYMQKLWHAFPSGFVRHFPGRRELGAKVTCVAHQMFAGTAVFARMLPSSCRRALQVDIWCCQLLRCL